MLEEEETMSEQKDIEDGATLFQTKKSIVNLQKRQQKLLKKLLKMVKKKLSMTFSELFWYFDCFARNTLIIMVLNISSKHKHDLCCW